MSGKLLIPLYGDEVAPRFDLAGEVLIVDLADDGTVKEDRIIVVSQASAEALCHLVLKEDIDAVICGGIEEEYHQYLKWKRVDLVDAVIGPWKRALSAWIEGTLSPGTILYQRRDRHEC
jgi:predicted Fe-Mo cluster-binding NifX family protein